MWDIKCHRTQFNLETKMFLKCTCLFFIEEDFSGRRSFVNLKCSLDIEVGRSLTMVNIGFFLFVCFYSWFFFPMSICYRLYGYKKVIESWVSGTYFWLFRQWHIFASEQYFKICEKRNSIWEDDMQQWSWGEGYPGCKSGVNIL